MKSHITIVKVFSLVMVLIVWMGCRQQQRTPGPAGMALQTSFEKLINGNNRFSHLRPVHPDEDLQHLRDAAKGQHPFAVVVCCADSRVSPELIFDQGMGDLFVIRTAGHILGGLEIGSIEYAVEHLGVKLIVVMGHEDCGAVKAFIEKSETPGHIKDIVDSLKQEMEIMAIPATAINRLDDCVKANVAHGIKQLKTQSAVILEQLEKGELQVVGVRYDLDDFKISILDQ